MKFQIKTPSVVLLLATLSTPVYAAVPVNLLEVEFSDIFSRGNFGSDDNDSFELILGAGTSHQLIQIDFDARVLANAALNAGFFVAGTSFSDLSVNVHYQDSATNQSINLGFDVLNTNYISSSSADSITGSLQNSDGSPHQFSGWKLKTGGRLSFSFNELNDDANLEGLVGSSYWDAQWQNGSKLTLVAAPVPEPEAYAMLMAGLGLVLIAARRRKNTV
jgi:hypothetical protein